MNNPNTDFKIQASDTPMFDAFSRLRVSTAHTKFDIQNQYNSTGLFYENVITGGGTVTHLPNESTVSLNVGTASGDKVVRQSRNYFRYEPGKSQLVIMSRVFGATKENVRKRGGLFDANNGLFFEDNGTNFAVVQRSYTSGSPVDTRVPQSAWNLDRLNSSMGLNSSGIQLDISKANIYYFDFEWLGVGPSTFGIFHNGKPIECHRFNNNNSLTTPYMSTGNLPLRHELENIGVSGSSTSLKVICTTVMSEDGGDSPLGLNFSASNGATAVAVTTRRAILSIRPKATFNSIVNRGLITDISFELLATTNNSYYEIVYGGALGGSPSWTSANTDSIVEYDIAGTTVTGGIVVASGFVVAGLGSVSTATGLRSLLSKLPLTLDIAGANPINLSIVTTAFTGTSNVCGSFNWKEIY